MRPHVLMAGSDCANVLMIPQVPIMEYFAAKLTHLVTTIVRTVHKLYLHYKTFTFYHFISTILSGQLLSYGRSRARRQREASPIRCPSILLDVPI